MRRQSIVAGCRMSESRIIVGSSRGGVARVSHANIFNPFQGWKPDGMPDGSKFLAKNPPKGILSFSLGERDDERVLLLLLFERIFSRMIHWRPIRPLPFPSRYLSLNATGDFDRWKRATTNEILPILRGEKFQRHLSSSRRMDKTRSVFVYLRYVSSLSSEWINIFFIIISFIKSGRHFRIGNREKLLEGISFPARIRTNRRENCPG